MLNRKLRMGMIGGGPGAFIGAIHRMAAIMDGEIELVCGAFSSDPERSKQTGAALYLPAERVYGSYKEMIRREAELPVNERMDFVSIVTPNYLHFEPAKLALENGFHVVLDKPITFDLAEAKELKTIVEKSGKLFCLTHTYTGYPMLKEARQQVLGGKFGAIRKVYVEYPQGWLSTLLESSSNKQADWRTDPSRSGAAGAVGDIGTHAFNMVEYVTGLRVTQVCADVNIIVEGRKLDDDGSVLLRFDNSASGILFITQVVPGEENNIRLRVFGEKGGLDWSHKENNTLYIKWPDKPTEIWRAGESYLGSLAKHNSRTPAGHPEGYIEAFANHYRNFALCAKAQMTGEKPREEWLDFPGIEEGIRGMLFIDAVLRSARSENKWTFFE
ncbi:MAG: Gfo/Idh/MocA family oxidoreductase [Chitinophagaceae bacterium]